jgi:integrase
MDIVKTSKILICFLEGNVMHKGQNFNHPKKGSSIKVEPIKSKKHIQTIKKLLVYKPLDYALFVIGINTNLRASDLLRIKVGQVRDLQPNGEVVINEQKTRKKRRINLNKACIEAIQGLLASRKYSDEDYLFTGQRGRLTVPTVGQKVKTWCRAINLRGNFSSHSLRKSWGFHQRVTFGNDLPRLMVCFNHSTQRQTLDYLCIQPEEIKNVYENEL